MIGFDKKITIYNQWFDPQTKVTSWHKTVVDGASWSGGQRVKVGEGLTSSDGYSVRIPYKALESVSSVFLERDQYVSLEDPEGFYTAQNGDTVILGEGPEVEKNIAEVTKRFTNCFTVTAVNTSSLLRLLSHLRLEGV